MNEAQILKRLAQVFDEASFTLDRGLDRDVVLEEIDGLDSVSRLRFMLSVEQAFTIEVSPLENSKLKTVGELVDIIQARLQHRSANR
jgi:acyl carrier protein